MELEGISQEILRRVREELNREERVKPKAEIWYSDIPARLEHSLLNPDTGVAQIMDGCMLAKKYGIAALCVAPYHVAAAAEQLYGSRTAVCAAVGFPHGCMSTAAKVAEIRECTNQGAKEIDVALNVLAIKSKDFTGAKNDLLACVDAANGRALVKAVFEHSLFTDDEKKYVLEMIPQCGAGYLKVQNMLSGHGARVEEIRLVRSVIGDSVRIKIDGGVKTLEKAIELFDAGADRIGLTATAAICDSALSCARCN